MPIERITIIGTGLIGASIGLALQDAAFSGAVTGIDASGDELHTALELGAITHVARSPEEHRASIASSDLVVLAVPVLAVLQWMQTISPLLREGQLVTDTGSTKLQITEAGLRMMPGQFLPGHPMAGKESGGAALAEASLFHGTTWLFTPQEASISNVCQSIETEWRDLVQKFGAHTLDVAPGRHDELCAWVSHLPQFVATAMSALLEDTFGDNPELRAIGGRALREMTRLGSSPFSMWRDIAHTNEAPVAHTLLALEQRLQHLRENLRTPELREEFARANNFRRQHPPQAGPSDLLS